MERRRPHNRPAGPNRPLQRSLRGALVLLTVAALCLFVYMLRHTPPSVKNSPHAHANTPEDEDAPTTTRLSQPTLPACNIPRYSMPDLELSVKELAGKLAKNGTPFILRDEIASTSPKFFREYIESQMDVEHTLMVDPNMALRYDIGSENHNVTLTLQEYFAGGDAFEQKSTLPYLFAQPYIFQLFHSSECARLRFPFPRVFSGDLVADNDYVCSFIAGNTGTGAYFHQHGPATSAVYRGAKEWFLVPPGDAVSSDFVHPNGAMLTLAEWAGKEAQSYENVLKRCRVHEGETLYIPDRWWHATANFGNTISLTHQY